MNFQFLIPAITLLAFTLSACKDKDINIFTIQDDKNFGAQVDAEIEQSGEFVILDRNAYSDAYQYLEDMKTDILNSGKVKYKDDFVWELHIIHEDSVQNAFATPGGYIYVYTGLIHYLDNKSALAGVMGHEIAHADERHSTEQLTKIYGLSTMISIALGNEPGLLAQVAQGLLTLKFSRSNESEADERSVDYLCSTHYRADGAADFFIQIQQAGGSSVPEFLSTHPSPDNRVADIQAHADASNCVNTINTSEENAGYDAFKAMLP